MGINQIQLTPELIALLYPESLVVMEDMQPVKKTVKTTKTTPSAATPYPFQGKNQRQISFLVHNPEGDFLPEVQLAFLQKMLAACKYGLDDIALLNTAKIPFDLAQWRLQFTPRIVFLWGITPASVGLKPGLPDFAISTLDGISVVPVLSPDLMSGSNPQGTEYKQRLWACLKKLFTL
jgi:hypothetical protein